MLNQDLLEIIENRVKQDIEDRRNLFDHEIAQINENMAAKNSLFSGATVRSILDAIESEYRVRVSLIWQSFARALDGKGIALSNRISDEVKNHLARMLDVHSADLPKHHSDLNGLLRGQKPRRSIDELRMAAIERIYSEIDYVSLKHSNSSSAISTVLNIYQSYGIVQTGLGSTASFSVTIGSQERQEIVKVIESVQKLLQTSSSLSPEQKTEAKELVSDLGGEIQRAKPNSHRIRGALQGLATTVQTIAAAPEVYQLIKGAAALFGLQLP